MTPAPRELPGWLRAALAPEEGVSLEVREGEVLLTVRADAGGILHLELSRGAERDALCHLGELAVSYRLPDGDASGDAQVETDHKRAVARCRALCERLRPLASALLAEVDAAHAAARARGGRNLLFYEDELLRSPDPAAEVARAVAASEGHAAGSREPLESITLHLDEPCDQACRYCWFAQERDDDELARTRRWRRARNADDEANVVTAMGAMLAALGAAPEPGQLVLFGYDYALHPDRDALFDLLEAEERAPIVLVGPGTHLVERGLVERLARLRVPLTVELGLHGAAAQTHDDLVGRPGAHAGAMRSLEALRRAGIHTRVFVMATAANLAELPALLATVSAQGAEVKLSVFRPERLVRARRRGWPLELLAVAPVALRPQLEAAAAAAPVRGNLDALAVCATPPALRPLLSRSAPSQAEPPFVFFEACEGCRHRASCVGVSAAVAERFGAEAVAPETGDSAG